MTSGEISRRRLLTAAAAATGAAAVTTLIPAGAAQAAPGSRPGTQSANGWPVLAYADRHPVEGSGQEVRLAGGTVALLLTYVARRFHYEIDQLRAGDLHGYTPSAPVEVDYESNHLSGTALAIRPRAYPLGARGGLYPGELVVVRDILAELGGVVTWGGDFDRPKESHFQIAHPPGHPDIAAVARKIHGAAGLPGDAGAGAVDAFEPARRVRARAFARRTR